MIINNSVINNTIIISLKLKLVKENAIKDSHKLLSVRNLKI